MKTTLDLPSSLLSKVNAIANENNQSLDDFVAEALIAHISSRKGVSHELNTPEWRKHYGGLAHLTGEVRRIQREIDNTFGVVDRTSWE